MEHKPYASPRWLELVTDMAHEKDVGPDRLWSVCLIKRVEDPAVLSQHRGIRQGDATRIEPKWPWRCGEKGGRIHFHPKSISSTDTFIQTRFHPMTLSSKNGFIQ